MENKSSETKIDVVAYSGYRANERPMYIILGHSKVEVTEVLDRWFGQNHDYFKVLAGDGRSYLIKWHRSQDAWFLIKAIEEDMRH